MRASGLESPKSPCEEFEPSQKGRNGKIKGEMRFCFRVFFSMKSAVLGSLERYKIMSKRRTSFHSSAVSGKKLCWPPNLYDS